MELTEGEKAVALRLMEHLLHNEKDTGARMAMVRTLEMTMDRVDLASTRKDFSRYLTLVLFKFMEHYRTLTKARSMNLKVTTGPFRNALRMVDSYTDIMRSLIVQAEVASKKVVPLTKVRFLSKRAEERPD